jgi:hypothetical protein
LGDGYLDRPVTDRPLDRPDGDRSDGDRSDGAATDLPAEAGIDRAACREDDRRPCGSSVGACRPGFEWCRGGAWGPCEGATGPAGEICNGADDDCDGETDDGDGACGGVCELAAPPGDACDGADPDTCADDERVCAGRNATDCRDRPDGDGDGWSAGPESCAGDCNDADPAVHAAEPDAAFCGRLGAECGSARGTDACGTVRSVDCGGCPAPATCGGGGTPNRCGAPAGGDVWVQLDYGRAYSPRSPAWSFSATPGWGAAQWAMAGDTWPEAWDRWDNMRVTDDPIGRSLEIGSSSELQLMIGLEELRAYRSMTVRLEGRSRSTSSAVRFDVTNPLTGCGVSGTMSHDWTVHVAEIDLGDCAVVGAGVQAVRVSPHSGTLALVRMRVTLHGAEW